MDSVSWETSSTIDRVTKPTDTMGYLYKWQLLVTWLYFHIFFDISVRQTVLQKPNHELVLPGKGTYQLTVQLPTTPDEVPDSKEKIPTRFVSKQRDPGIWAEEVKHSSQWSEKSRLHMRRSKGSEGPHRVMKREALCLILDTWKGRMWESPGRSGWGRWTSGTCALRAVCIIESSKNVTTTGLGCKFWICWPWLFCNLQLAIFFLPLHHLEGTVVRTAGNLSLTVREIVRFLWGFSAMTALKTRNLSACIVNSKC